MEWQNQTGSLLTLCPAHGWILFYKRSGSDWAQCVLDEQCVLNVLNVLSKLDPV